MTAESNSSFSHDGSFGSSMSHQAISVQSGPINSSSSDMIQMTNHYGVNNNNTESVPGIKHETGLAVECSIDEQYKLEEGLKKKRKQRKQEDHNHSKKAKDRKDKLVELLGPPLKHGPFAMLMSQIDHIPIDALYGPMSQLLEESNQALDQISSNLSSNPSTEKLQDNVDLFLRARNNLTTILNGMEDVLALTSRMPPQ